MSNEQTKANAEFNQETNSVNAFNEASTDNFRNKWGYDRNPHMGYGPGYGYGYPYHHHHYWHHPYGYGYGHPYGYHHYGMYGPGYVHGMYGGYPYAMQQMYGRYPTPYQQRAEYDPAFFSTGVGFPQQGFASAPTTFPQAGFPNQEFAPQPPFSTPAGSNVNNQVIQGTATPVRKPRTNNSKN